MQRQRLVSGFPGNSTVICADSACRNCWTVTCLQRPPETGWKNSGIDKCLAACRTGRGGGVILLIKKKYKCRVKVCVLYRGKRLCVQCEAWGSQNSSVGWFIINDVSAEPKSFLDEVTTSRMDSSFFDPFLRSLPYTYGIPIPYSGATLRGWLHPGYRVSVFRQNLVQRAAFSEYSFINSFSAVYLNTLRLFSSA